jgi:hypothetical protein
MRQSTTQGMTPITASHIHRYVFPFSIFFRITSMDTLYAPSAPQRRVAVSHTAILKTGWPRSKLLRGEWVCRMSGAKTITRLESGGVED